MSFEIKKFPKQVDKLYRNITCDGCGTALKNVYSDEYLQPDDALILRLEGGYGMAIDPCGDATDQELTKIFCKVCLEKLCEQWPCFFETIKNHCCSSVGHHCSKEKKFVWRTMSECCSVYCRFCGRFGSTQNGLEIENDWYSRPIIECHGPKFHKHCSGCDNVGPGIWAWETQINWYVEYAKNLESLDEDVEVNSVRIGPYPTREEALNEMRIKEAEGWKAWIEGRAKVD